MVRNVPNPGGHVVPDQIIGRDAEIARLWDTLRQRSVLLLAPRRMGKTSIARKMTAEPQDGFTVRLRDLEGRTRASHLVDLLLSDVDTLLSPIRQASGRARAAVESIAGAVETKWFAIRVPERDWRVVLDAMIDDLNAQAAEHGTLLVLIWDEFPLFIRDIARSGHPDEAMALLDLLRAARSRCPHLRMVLTGSIGLHEVIRALRKQGYSNDPVNDLAKELVDVLKPGSAHDLSESLLIGIERDGAERLAGFLAERCEGHPYVIHHVAHELRYAERIDGSAIEGALDRLIDGSQDPLDLGHYVERLAHTLDGDELQLAKDLLDALAVRPDGLTAAELRLALPDRDREGITQRLADLRRDLYVDRAGERFTFRRQFLRRWWARERGLDGE